MTPCPAKPSADHPSAPVSRKADRCKTDRPPRSLALQCTSQHVPEGPSGYGLGPRPSAGDIAANTVEGVASIHEQPFAWDGSNGQLLIVTVEPGAKIGKTVPMPILRHPMAGKDGAFLRVGMPVGPTTAAARERSAEVLKLQHDAGPQALYAAQSPVKVCGTIGPPPRMLRVVVAAAP